MKRKESVSHRKGEDIIISYERRRERLIVRDGVIVDVGTHGMWRIL